jgi:hypothetical protein
VSTDKYVADILEVFVAFYLRDQASKEDEEQSNPLSSSCTA